MRKLTEAVIFPANPGSGIPLILSLFLCETSIIRVNDVIKYSMNAIE
jgi:hypothetical protein